MMLKQYKVGAIFVSTNKTIIVCKGCENAQLCNGMTAKVNIYDFNIPGNSVISVFNLNLTFVLFCCFDRFSRILGCQRSSGA